jgi:hypothetical protein
MSTASRLAARLFLLVLLTTVSHTSLRAQERAPENRSTPIVTATVSAERVRFIAPSDTTAVRLEVYTVDGQRLVDSGFKSGSFLDWTMLDEQGQRHPAGAYLCVVAVKSLSGRVSHKLGTLNLPRGRFL